MDRARTIAIVGGGASASLTAYHLERLRAADRLLIIEPRAQLGLGLAYSTTSMQHLLNVPAESISALPDEPDHFLCWLRANYHPVVDPSDFVPRAVFGRYLLSVLSSLKTVEHLPIKATGVQVTSRGQASLSLADGTTVLADIVLLALGNFSPATLPGVSPAVIASGVYTDSAWSEETYSNLAASAAVTLIGTGLTAVDVLLKLRETGHRGVVTAISRHGVFPAGHAAYEPLHQPALEGAPPFTARRLLREMHHALKNSISWRATVDSLRARTNELWLALPTAEQKRFRRHLLRRWELVRHRMAPAIAERLATELAAGTLVKAEGSLQAVVPAESGARVHFFSRAGAPRELLAARVINCTGPDMNYQRVNSLLLGSLFAQGLATAGPLGIGLDTGENGALRSSDGSFSKTFFAVGPARLGTLLESIAIPEIREQAAGLAAHLAVSSSVNHAQAAESLA